MTRPNDGYQLRRGAIPGTQPGKKDNTHTAREDRRKKAAKMLAELAPEVLLEVRLEGVKPIKEWTPQRGKTDPAEQRRRNLIRKQQKDGGRVNRQEIIERDKSRCWICKKFVAKSLIHLDHVIPLSKGGRHHESNVKVTCKSCNEWKGDRIITPV